MNLLARLRLLATQTRNPYALSDHKQQLTHLELISAVEQVSDQLKASGLHRVGLQLDNSLAWIIFDLAALSTRVCLIPLPPFFSKAQRQHAIEQASIQAIVTDQPEHFSSDWHAIPFDVADQPLNWLEHADIPASKDSASHDDIAPEVDKITFTSGTTGSPKGVMLGWQHIQPVVESLVTATNITANDRHLCLLPLSVLLENLAGVYAPLWAGATVIVPPLDHVGLSGSSQLNPLKMRDALATFNASTAIFTPHTLQALVECQETQPQPLPKLRFAAVGGAPVSPRLLIRAQEQGIPVREGYGLSECASVVTLNTAHHDDSNPRGSVGKALPHVRLEISDQHEIMIHSPGFFGYLGDTSSPDKPWPSGDIGYLDDDGYLFITGRQRNVFITSFGRNVSPEWVERELTLESAISQAAVIGEGRPWNIGLIVSRADQEDIDSAIERVNKDLPDYAQIHRWIRADDAFTPGNGLLTGTGRLRRDALNKHYQKQISQEYAGHA